MQDLKYDHVKVNLNPRPNEFKAIDTRHRQALAYFGAIAERKKFAASLIVNLYNPNICGADMNRLSAYCRGETCPTFRNGMNILIQICAYIESHEIYGDAFIERLIKRWNFRNKRT